RATRRRSPGPQPEPEPDGPRGRPHPRHRRRFTWPTTRTGTDRNVGPAGGRPMRVTNGGAWPTSRTGTGRTAGPSPPPPPGEGHLAHNPNRNRPERGARGGRPRGQHTEHPPSALSADEGWPGVDVLLRYSNHAELADTVADVL